MELIDQVSAARFIHSMVPDWTWLLMHIESEDGYVRFPPLFSRMIANLKIENYPQLYENEASIGLTMLRAFLGPDELKVLDVELASSSPEGRGELLHEVAESLAAVLDAIEIPKTSIEQEQAEAAFDALSEEERRAASRFWQHYWMAFLAGFYQSVSVMVHGEKLTALVAQAKAGNDKAFAKAVQIDKRILLAVPYFKQRFADAQTVGDREFTEEVGAHLQRPPYKGKIRHKSLYLTFAFLDQVGLLDTMKHKDILDLCDAAGTWPRFATCYAWRATSGSGSTPCRRFDCCPARSSGTAG